MEGRPSSFWSWMGCEVTLKSRRSLRSFRLYIAHKLLLSMLVVSEAVLRPAEPSSFYSCSAAGHKYFDVVYG